MHTSSGEKDFRVFFETYKKMCSEKSPKVTVEKEMLVSSWGADRSRPHTIPVAWLPVTVSFLPLTV